MAQHDPETNPVAFLGDELRRARLASGFSSQDALAGRLGFDRSVITKVERGDRAPSVDVLSAWCAACALDVDHFARLAALARRADGPVPSWFESWLEAEREAHTLRLWSPLLVPGLFQTADYARELFSAAGADEDEANEMADARLERRSILDRPDPPHIVAVLSESVLHSQVGSAVTMSEQLEHVARVSERKNVAVHILPATGANAGMSGAFDIASTDGAPDTLRVEGVEDLTTENRALVRKASVIFDLVRSEALPRTPSRTAILGASEKWKTA
jgi:transcriptional regulator with XRE-family HTH domain